MKGILFKDHEVVELGRIPRKTILNLCFKVKIDNIARNSQNNAIIEKDIGKVSIFWRNYR